MKLIHLGQVFTVSAVVVLILVCEISHTGGQDVEEETEASITYSDTFKVTSCGTPDDPVVIKNVIVMPDPIVTPGKVIVTLTMEVKKLLFSPIELDIETQRQIGDRWVTMPCIYQFLGSCKYEDVCKLFLKAPPLCPKEVQRKFPCKCPVEPNVYQMDAMEVPLDYGDFIAGKYHSIVKGSNWMFNQLMCYIIDFEIVKVDRPT